MEFIHGLAHKSLYEKKKTQNKRKARALIGQLPITICPWVHCEG